MNEAAMNDPVQVFLWVHGFVSLGEISRYGIERWMFKVVRRCQIMFPVVVASDIPAAVGEGPPHPHQHPSDVNICHVNHSRRCAVAPHMVFICTFPVVTD